jgi:PAS domain S-box-containing protein
VPLSPRRHMPRRATGFHHELPALIPFARRLLLIIWPFLAVVTLLVLLTGMSLELLSSLRGFVGGEGLWSKAQKDGVIHLSNYARSHSEADYLAFKSAIRVSLGDRQAREELEKSEPNYNAVYEGFKAGGVHAEDIPGMVRVFRWLRGMVDVDRAIVLWTQGDRYIAELNQVADELHQQIGAGHTDAATLAPMLERVRLTSEGLAPLEDEFSSALGEASRKARLLLLIAITLVAATLMPVGIFFSRRMLKQSEAFEEALRLSEERFRLAVTGSNDGIWDWNLLTGEVYRSPRFMELLGYAEYEIASEHMAFVSLLHPEDRAATIAVIQGHLQGNTPYNFECRLKTKSGEYRWFKLRGQAVRNPEGEAVRVAGAITDITDQKQAEEDIRLLNAELEARVVQRTTQLESSLKELDAFSYSVSHDLRAPLRHVNAYATMLGEECAAFLNDAGRSYIAAIVKSAKRMDDLINDLLDFARMGRAELRRRLISMDSLVAEVLEEMHDATQGRAIEWQIAPLPDVLADRAMLKQVWSNLLSNAVKYTARRELAVIKVGCRSGVSGDWEFFVEDNGAGFDMEYADKLFGVFQRLHRADEFPGTGIGLANVRRIITRHGGLTWAEAEVDVGAIVYFTLPRTVS